MSEKPSHADQIARAHLLALAGRGVVQVGDDAVGILAERVSVQR